MESSGCLPLFETLRLYNRLILTRCLTDESVSCSGLRPLALFACLCGLLDLPVQVDTVGTILVSHRCRTESFALFKLLLRFYGQYR